MLGYQLPLTNGSPDTAQVTGFGVACYDSTGSELGSDTQQWDKPQYLTPDQSLTWTEYASTDVNGGTFPGGSASVPPGAATCQLVTWMRP